MIFFYLILFFFVDKTYVSGFLYDNNVCCTYYPQQIIPNTNQPTSLSYLKIPIYTKIKNLPFYPQPIQQIDSPFASAQLAQPQQNGGAFQNLDMNTLYVQPSVDPTKLTNIIIYDRPISNYLTAPKDQISEPIISTPTLSFNVLSSLDKKTKDSDIDKYPLQNNSSHIEQTETVPGTFTEYDEINETSTISYQDVEITPPNISLSTPYLENPLLELSTNLSSSDLPLKNEIPTPRNFPQNVPPDPENVFLYVPHVRFSPNSLPERNKFQAPYDSYSAPFVYNPKFEYFPSYYSPSSYNFPPQFDIFSLYYPSSMNSLHRVPSQYEFQLPFNFSTRTPTQNLQEPTKPFLYYPIFRMEDYPRKVIEISSSIRSKHENETPKTDNM
uniref:Uncharacterized protein n=1 Tax=Parastrongyloides trichosuri TaxID=131310 RepID=A0A0N4ZA61_PARTI